MLSLSTENDSPRLSASFSEFLPVASKEFSVRITAERLINIEVVVAVRNRSPVAATGAVVDGESEAADSIFLEVLAPPEPPPDLTAEIVAHGASAAGVDEVPVTGVQGQLPLLVQLQQIPVRKEPGKLSRSQPMWKSRVLLVLLTMV